VRLPECVLAPQTTGVGADGGAVGPCSRCGAARPRSRRSTSSSSCSYATRSSSCSAVSVRMHRFLTAASIAASSRLGAAHKDLRSDQSWLSPSCIDLIVGWLGMFAPARLLPDRGAPRCTRSSKERIAGRHLLLLETMNGIYSRACTTVSGCNAAVHPFIASSWLRLRIPLCVCSSRPDGFSKDDRVAAYGSLN
jgi:hypothetical protein